MSFEKDYGKQEFLKKWQGEDTHSERAGEQKLQKLALLMGVLASYGMLSDDVVDTVIEEAQFASNQAEDQIQEGDLDHQRILEDDLLESNLKSNKSNVANKIPKNIDYNEILLKDQNLINTLVDLQYEKYEDSADFHLTLERNDKDGKIREEIAELGKEFGDSEHISIYQAIAATESRFKQEKSADGGEGYFQITNIPKEVEKTSLEIAKKNNLTTEELNILQGILTFEHYLEKVRAENPIKDPATDEKYDDYSKALRAYNAGLDNVNFSMTYQEFLKLYAFKYVGIDKMADLEGEYKAGNKETVKKAVKEEMRYDPAYPIKVMAWKRKLEE
ncbi:transglycosylase SLT domain-containing protein [Patescibacteria group bacterium]